MLELRPYQTQAVDAIRAEIRAGRRRVLLQMPTGGGKTAVASSILVGALARGSPTLFLVHRIELLDQTVATFARLDITSLGVIRANDRRRDLSQPIQIASVATLARRSKPPAKVVIVDECHRATAKTYEDILAAYPDATVIGLTATPIRTNGKPLGEAFDCIVSGGKYSDLIAAGWLTEPMVYGTPVVPDLSRVHTTAGDFDAKELEDAVNRSALIGNVVDEWERRAEGRRSVAFAVSIAHSRAIVEAFRDRGHKCEHLDGTTPEEERRAILSRLASGETTIVSNVGVLCEGWDMPSCKCLIVARPTKSLGLWMQMAGRILRPFEGMTPLVLDHAGNVDRHGLPHEDREWSLEKRTAKPKAPAQKCCPTCFAYIASACRVCPYCAHAFAVISVAEPPEALDAVGLALRTLTGDDAQLAFWKATAKKAKERGWKPGVVYHRFTERFGREPAIEWTRALKRASKKDAEWALRLSAREASRA